MMTDFDPDELLQTDSWESADWLGYSSPSMMDTLDDFPNFLDRELDSIDMSAALRSDMEIPMLADTFPLDLTSKIRYDDAMLCRSDSDSGLSTDGGSFGGLTIKQEPLSPTSSFSSDSTDSHNLLTQPHGISEADLDFSTYLSSDKDPPLTPPYEPHDRLSANHNQLTSVVVNKSPNHNQAKIKLANRIHARNKLTNEKASTPASLSVGSRVTVVQKQPLVTTLGPGNKINDKASPKPIILSADDFQRLASQGVLRFQNPKVPTKLVGNNNNNNNIISASSNAPISVKPSQQTVAKEKTVAKPSVAMVTVNDGGDNEPLPRHMTIKDEIDLRTWKRHQRMIKNRESACLSRKRKKEHLQCLEQQLAESAHENDQLREENHVLKKRVELLEAENERFRKKFGGKAASLFALAFLLCLNLGPVSNLWQSSPSHPMKPLQPATSPHGAGRHLLSLLDLPSGEESLNQSNGRAGVDFEKQVQELRDTMESWNRTHEGLLIKSLEALSVFNDCPSYFNKTESLRLANELTGWVLAHTKANATKPSSSKETPPKPRRKIPKKYRSLKVFNRNAPPAVGAASRDGQSYQMQLFRNQDRRFTDFFEAIQRRNDTFYVVSFRKDHLLLPATAHNKTMRPRMSLVMPAVSLNSSIEPPDGSVAMMQIDCEVTATRLIHVAQSTAPDQSRADPPGQSDNATSSSRDEADTASATSQEEVVFETEN